MLVRLYQSSVTYSSFSGLVTVPTEGVSCWVGLTSSEFSLGDRAASVGEISTSTGGNLCVGFVEEFCSVRLSLPFSSWCCSIGFSRIWLICCDSSTFSLSMFFAQLCRTSL